MTMDTASFQFLLFGLGVALISNISRSSAWRSAVLLVASIVFLGLLAPNPIVLLPLIGFLLFGFAELVLIERGWSGSLAWSVLGTVFVYVWLKKYTFLPEKIFLHSPYFTLGLSYIFFRVLHLLIEAKDRPGQRQVGVVAYLLYNLNFTTFISGPIQRYDDFAEGQFAADPVALGPGVIGLQLERIVRGLFKVNVLAMLFDIVRTDAYSRISQSLPLPPPLKLYAVFLLLTSYPLFLYANFSGYIDIVIALARLMRLRLPENFDRPFSASSALDFWNRWHMTLSNWLKAYVYNPLLLTLMRRISSPGLEPLLGVFCFFVTFFLIGVWHGRTTEFVVFGVLTGGGMSINKLWQLGLTRAMGRKSYKKLSNNDLYNALGRGLNFIWFGFTLFWFWADWSRIDRIFHALSLGQWLGVLTGSWLLATVALASWEWLRAALLSITAFQQPLLTSRYARTVYATALGIVSLVVTTALNQPAPAIVYKVF
jgi:D-alanyl-lipoteichoic acid acyltransferase DltB (MBOAT superfamily)